MRESRDHKGSQDAINVLVMSLGAHSYLLLPLTLAQSHWFFSTLAGICFFKKKKKCTNSPSHTSFILLSRSLTHSVQHQSHSLSLRSEKSRQDFYIHKKVRGKKTTPTV